MQIENLEPEDIYFFDHNHYYPEFFDANRKCTNITGFLYQQFEDYGVDAERGDEFLKNVLFLEYCLNPSVEH